MNRSKRTMLTAGVALALVGTHATTALAQTVDIVRAAQATQVEKIAESNSQPAPPAQSPMVKPPNAASGTTGSANPDNMPIRRPDQPTNDNMSRQPPASGANAK
jgi:hypothetical protein